MMGHVFFFSWGFVFSPPTHLIFCCFGLDALFSSLFFMMVFFYIFFWLFGCLSAADETYIFSRLRDAMTSCLG
ncbi:hypothetical protein F4861DRAFT_491988 [Xylaria intraflava]|nr:hypothetical protein F4861DRAFT_491988 [Xylaria intraflava]